VSDASDGLEISGQSTEWKSEWPCGLPCPEEVRPSVATDRSERVGL